MPKAKRSLSASKLADVKEEKTKRSKIPIPQKKIEERLAAKTQEPAARAAAATKRDLGQRSKTDLALRPKRTQKLAEEKTAPKKAKDEPAQEVEAVVPEAVVVKQPEQERENEVASAATVQAVKSKAKPASSKAAKRSKSKETEEGKATKIEESIADDAKETKMDDAELVSAKKTSKRSRSGSAGTKKKVKQDEAKTLQKEPEEEKSPAKKVSLAEKPQEIVEEKTPKRSRSDSTGKKRKVKAKETEAEKAEEEAPVDVSKEKHVDVQEANAETVPERDKKKRTRSGSTGIKKEELKIESDVTMSIPIEEALQKVEAIATETQATPLPKKRRQSSTSPKKIVETMPEEPPIKPERSIRKKEKKLKKKKPKEDVPESQDQNLPEAESKDDESKAVLLEEKEPIVIETPVTLSDAIDKEKIPTAEESTPVDEARPKVQPSAESTKEPSRTKDLKEKKRKKKIKERSKTEVVLEKPPEDTATVIPLEAEVAVYQEVTKEVEQVADSVDEMTVLKQKMEAMIEKNPSEKLDFIKKLLQSVEAPPPEPVPEDTPAVLAEAKEEEVEADDEADLAEVDGSIQGDDVTSEPDIIEDTKAMADNQAIDSDGSEMEESEEAQEDSDCLCSGNEDDGDDMDEGEDAGNPDLILDQDNDEDKNDEATEPLPTKTEDDDCGAAMEKLKKGESTEESSEDEESETESDEEDIDEEVKDAKDIDKDVTELEDRTDDLKDVTKEEGIDDNVETTEEVETTDEDDSVEHSGHDDILEDAKVIDIKVEETETTIAMEDYLKDEGKQAENAGNGSESSADDEESDTPDGDTDSDIPEIVAEAEVPPPVSPIIDTEDESSEVSDEDLQEDTDHDVEEEEQDKCPEVKLEITEPTEEAVEIINTVAEIPEQDTLGSSSSDDQESSSVISDKLSEDNDEAKEEILNPDAQDVDMDIENSEFPKATADVEEVDACEAVQTADDQEQSQALAVEDEEPDEVAEPEPEEPQGLQEEAQPQELPSPTGLEKETAANDKGERRRSSALASQINDLFGAIAKIDVVASSVPIEAGEVTIAEESQKDIEDEAGEVQLDSTTEDIAIDAPDKDAPKHEESSNYSAGKEDATKELITEIKADTEKATDKEEVPLEPIPQIDSNTEDDTETTDLAIGALSIPMVEVQIVSNLEDVETVSKEKRLSVISTSSVDRDTNTTVHPTVDDAEVVDTCTDKPLDVVEDNQILLQDGDLPPPASRKASFASGKSSRKNSIAKSAKRRESQSSRRDSKASLSDVLQVIEPAQRRRSSVLKDLQINTDGDSSNGARRRSHPGVLAESSSSSGSRRHSAIPAVKYAPLPTTLDHDILRLQEAIEEIESQVEEAKTNDEVQQPEEEEAQPTDGTVEIPLDTVEQKESEQDKLDKILILMEKIVAKNAEPQEPTAAGEGDALDTEERDRYKSCPELSAAEQSLAQASASIDSESQSVATDSFMNRTEVSTPVGSEVEFALKSIIEMKSAMSKMMEILQERRRSSIAELGLTRGVAKKVAQFERQSAQAESPDDTLDLGSSVDMQIKELSDDDEEVISTKEDMHPEQSEESEGETMAKCKVVEEILLQPEQVSLDEPSRREDRHVPTIESILARDNEGVPGEDDPEAAQGTIKPDPSLDSGVSEDPLLPVCEQRRVFELEAMKALFEESPLEARAKVSQGDDLVTSTNNSLENNEEDGEGTKEEGAEPCQVILFGAQDVEELQIRNKEATVEDAAEDVSEKLQTRNEEATVDDTEDVPESVIEDEPYEAAQEVAFSEASDDTTSANISCSLCKRQEARRAVHENITRITDSLLATTKPIEEAEPLVSDVVEEEPIEKVEVVMKEIETQTLMTKEIETQTEDVFEDAIADEVAEELIDLSEATTAPSDLPFEAEKEPNVLVTSKSMKDEVATDIKTPVGNVLEKVEVFETKIIEHVQGKPEVPAEEQEDVEETAALEENFDKPEGNGVTENTTVSDSGMTHSKSETNLRAKMLQFSVSMDDIQNDNLTISFIGDSVNISSSSKVLARSSIDITQSDEGTKLSLRSLSNSELPTSVPDSPRINDRIQEEAEETEMVEEETVQDNPCKSSTQSLPPLELSDIEESGSSFQEVTDFRNESSDDFIPNDTPESGSSASLLEMEDERQKRKIRSKVGDSGYLSDRKEAAEITEKHHEMSTFFEENSSIDTVIDVIESAKNEGRRYSEQQSEEDTVAGEGNDDVQCEVYDFGADGIIYEEQKRRLLATTGSHENIYEYSSADNGEGKDDRHAYDEEPDTSSIEDLIEAEYQAELAAGACEKKTISNETLHSVLIDDPSTFPEARGYRGPYRRLGRRTITAGAEPPGAEGTKPKKLLRFASQVDGMPVYPLSNVTKLCKILFIGSSSAGKTSLIRRYVKNTFAPSYRATIGADFLAKVVQWDEKVTLRLQLWDIAGQDRFSLLSRSFYKDAVGAFIVSDLTRPETLEAVIRWKEELDNKVCGPEGDSLPCFLLANKCDLLEDTGLQSKHHSKICQQYGFNGWMQTSAKDDINVTEAMNMLLREIADKDITEPGSPTDQDSIVLEPEKKKKTCLC